MRTSTLHSLLAFTLLAAGCSFGFIAPQLGSGGSAGGSSDAGGPDASAAVLANPAPASELFVGANFWNMAWEGHGDFFQSNVDFAATTNPWNSQFLSDLAPYHVLRFMDWNLTTTTHNPQADWRTRKRKTDRKRGRWPSSGRSISALTARSRTTGERAAPGYARLLDAARAAHPGAARSEAAGVCRVLERGVEQGSAAA